VRLYVKGGLSLRETADKLGMKKDRVRRASLAYGLPIRTAARRPDLRLYSKAEIDGIVKECGSVRAAAESLGVCIRTLFQYRARLRKQAQKGRKGQK